MTFHSEGVTGGQPAHLPQGLIAALGRDIVLKGIPRESGGAGVRRRPRRAG